MKNELGDFNGISNKYDENGKILDGVEKKDNIEFYYKDGLLYKKITYIKNTPNNQKIIEIGEFNENLELINGRIKRTFFINGSDFPFKTYNIGNGLKKDENIAVENKEEENITLETKKDENIFVDNKKEDNITLESKKDENIAVENKKEDNITLETKKDETLDFLEDNNIAGTSKKVYSLLLENGVDNNQETSNIDTIKQFKEDEKNVMYYLKLFASKEKKIEEIKKEIFNKSVEVYNYIEDFIELIISELDEINRKKSFLKRFFSPGKNSNRNRLRKFFYLTIEKNLIEFKEKNFSSSKKEYFGFVDELKKFMKDNSLDDILCKLEKEDLLGEKYFSKKFQELYNLKGNI